MYETRKTPCYAVIFTSTQTATQQGYAEMAARMEELAQQQPGFLGLESVRSPEGKGVTISYWQDLPSIRAWKENPEHQTAQQLGKQKWYQDFTIEIAKIESVSHFSKD
tara:strand:- start:5605 stop:5928 length:324 start_codon:yes stop_codon:yes gene_type:complete